MKRTWILMNKPVYLGLSTLEMSKIVTYHFNDYVKPKYVEKAELLYMDTDSFIVYVKTEDISIDIQQGFATSNYDIFFYWDSLHAKLNSHYKAWSYMKKKHKKIKAYRKSV